MQLLEFENELDSAARTLTRRRPCRGLYRPSDGEAEAGSATPCRIRTVTVWLNAFIPGFIPGQTRAVGPAGQTALIPPLPGLDCFLTDQRTFSPLLGASSRMHSRVAFDLSTPAGPRIRQVHSVGTTHGVNCASGAVTCVRTAGTSAMRFFNFRSSTAGDLLTVELTGAAANPCLFGAPNIDYRGTLTVDFRLDPTRTFAMFGFDGMVDGFPAFEMYVSTNGGIGFPVFLMPPTTPFGLVGPAKRPVRALVPLVCPVLPLPAPSPSLPLPPGPMPAPAQGRPTLRIGSRGPAVIELQQRLNGLLPALPGLAAPLLVTDGDFGPKTDTAVRAFQRSRGLIADGIAGPNTWRLLVPAETEAEFETELEFAAGELESGVMYEAEQFFGFPGSVLSWAARSFWSYWSRQLDIAKRALSQQRYGCYCGVGSVCSGAKDSLDRCCQFHDSQYGAVGVGPGKVDMWTLDGLKRTIAADETLVRCSSMAINDGTPYGPAERAYQGSIVSIFGTRAAAGRAAIALRL